MKSCLRISSTKEEMKIVINSSAKYDEVLEEFNNKLGRIKKYFEKDKKPLRVTGKALTENEKIAIRAILKPEIDERITFGEESEVLGLHAIKRTFESSVEMSETKFIRGNLRSGQREEFSGSIAILGDLNYGAEVIAGDNIIVTGKLRGLAHAGANGNKKAIISANSIDATQVRISNIVKEIPDNDYKLPFIYLDGENIEVG